jgi:hypothetical protein
VFLVDDLGFIRLVDVMPRLVQPGGLGAEAAIVQVSQRRSFVSFLA